MKPEEINVAKRRIAQFLVMVLLLAMIAAFVYGCGHIGPIMFVYIFMGVLAAVFAFLWLMMLWQLAGMILHALFSKWVETKGEGE
jgi:hypothetical protein